MKLSDLTNLDFGNAGGWPSLAKAIAVVAVLAVVAGGGYWFFTRDQLDRLDAARRAEQQLREEFVAKQRVMANIETYRTQIEQMQEALQAMLRQLPTRTEMPDLLEDISNTGKRNGLNFSLFKPEAEQPREFYAAKPISIKARATYHQFGAFVSSIAALSRIVTLENASLTGTEEPQSERIYSRKDSKPLVIEATLQTYRYLDEDTDTGQGAAGAKNAVKGAGAKSK